MVLTSSHLSLIGITRRYDIWCNSTTQHNLLLPLVKALPFSQVPVFDSPFTTNLYFSLLQYIYIFIYFLNFLIYVSNILLVSQSPRFFFDFSSSFFFFFSFIPPLVYFLVLIFYLYLVCFMLEKSLVYCHWT